MNDISIWNMLKNINNSSLPQTKWSLSTRYPNHLLNIWIRVQKPLHVFQGLWHLPSAVCLFDGPKNHGKSLLQKFGEKKAVWKKIDAAFWETNKRHANIALRFWRFAARSRASLVKCCDSWIKKVYPVHHDARLISSFWVFYLPPAWDSLSTSVTLIPLLHSPRFCFRKPLENQQHNNSTIHLKTLQICVQ